MATLLVRIERCIDDHFPGFVECTLIDADGRRHEFIEKAPIVSMADLRNDSIYPQPGHVACVIEKTWLDASGRNLSLVSTELPWGMTSVAGDALFTVLQEQLTGS